jgi:hypothetical protein
MRSMQRIHSDLGNRRTGRAPSASKIYEGSAIARSRIVLSGPSQSHKYACRRVMMRRGVSLPGRVIDSGHPVPGLRWSGAITHPSASSAVRSEAHKTGAKPAPPGITNVLRQTLLCCRIGNTRGVAYPAAEQSLPKGGVRSAPPERDVRRAPRCGDLVPWVTGSTSIAANRTARARLNPVPAAWRGAAPGLLSPLDNRPSAAPGPLTRQPRSHAPRSTDRRSDLDRRHVSRSASR